MKKAINLVRALKNPVHAKKQVDKIHTIFLSLIFFVSALLVGMTFFTFYNVEKSKMRVQELKNEISKVETLIGNLNQYVINYEIIKKYNLEVAEFLKMLGTFPELNMDVFEHIDDNLTEGMTVDNFAIERSLITFKLSAPRMEDIISYVQVMRKDKLFSNVDWGNSIKFDSNTYYCNMKITLKVETK